MRDHDTDLRAACVDCGRDTEPARPDGSPDLERFDVYIVRAGVWAAAGMDGWRSGALCTGCLERRLGRPLAEDDYLAKPDSTRTTAASLAIECDPAYVAWVMAGEREGELP